MDIPDVQPHEPAARYADSITKYIVIYVCILVLAGVQFVIAYTHLSGTAMFARMLFVALAEAGLALMFFMHLWGEKRGFVLFVLILTGFVIMAMQYGWTDSYRMELGVPYSQSKPGAVQ
jgi:cytochrome c oxidase subunit IV